MKYIKKAITDIEELQKKFKTLNKKTLKELCVLFKGDNLDNELFDFNYKTLTGTITNRNNKIELSESFEVWDKEGNILFETTLKELRRLI